MNPAIHKLIDQAEGLSPTMDAFPALIGAVRLLACEVGNMQAGAVETPPKPSSGLGQAIPPAVEPMLSPSERVAALQRDLGDCIVSMESRTRWRALSDVLGIDGKRAEALCIAFGVSPTSIIRFR